MSRHRGAKLRRRYGLLGGISLLSPEYLLSVERWPFHAGPPDHFGLLSHLLDLLVSQLSTLIPMHSTPGFRSGWGYHRAPPLLFRRRPPQSNCPPDSVPPEGRLDFKTPKSGIWLMTPPLLAKKLQSLPPMLHIAILKSLSSYSKGSRGLSVFLRVLGIFTENSISQGL